jgi:hypothetical protein|nr:hypothetical protein [Ferrimicrobium sp.]
MYLMPASEVEHSIQTRMLVDIEHTPNFIVILAPTTPLVALFLALTINCALYERCRNTSKRIDHHDHIASISACPIHEVTLFRPLSFYEHKDLAATRPLRGASYRPATQ